MHRPDREPQPLDPAFVATEAGLGRLMGAAEELVAAAEAGGWIIDRLPVGAVAMWNPKGGTQDKCYRFRRANSVIEAATLIGRTGHQHPDAFWLHNGQVAKPVPIAYLYEMLGTLRAPADANGFATVPKKDPIRKHARRVIRPDGRDRNPHSTAPTPSDPATGPRSHPLPALATPVPSGGGWVDVLLASPAFAAQRERARLPRPLAADRIRRFLKAIDANGGTIALRVLAERTGEPADTLRMALTVVQRLLNLDGTEVLVVRSDGDIVLDQALAELQFGIER